MNKSTSFPDQKISDSKGDIFCPRIYVIVNSFIIFPIDLKFFFLSENIDIRPMRWSWCMKIEIKYVAYTLAKEATFLNNIFILFYCVKTVRIIF